MLSENNNQRIYIQLLTTGVLFFSFNTINAQAKPWPVPQSAIQKQNPVAGDASSIKTGKGLYVTYCSPCHGEKGKGDGPAAASLDPKPSNHTSAAVQSESDGSLFYKISEGRNSMPAFKTSMTEDKRWSLVNYIKSLSKKS